MNKNEKREFLIAYEIKTRSCSDQEAEYAVDSYMAVKNIEDDEVLTPGQIDEIINGLNQFGADFGADTDKYCFGLPYSEPEMSEIKQIIRDIIKGEQ